MPRMFIGAGEVLQRKRHKDGQLLVKLRKEGQRPYWRKMSWEAYKAQLNEVPRILQDSHVKPSKGE